MNRQQPLEIGTTECGRTLAISPEVRSMHMHVLGATGTGKSKVLEYAIRQMIAGQEGLLLLDPHGELYDELVRWCETQRLGRRRRIILVDPSSAHWSFGFNPLWLGPAADSSERAASAQAMLDAFAQVWGGEDMTRTPRMRRVLRSVLIVLAELNLTLLEAREVTRLEAHALRAFIGGRITDSYLRQDWEEFCGLSDRMFLEWFESTNNRLAEFLATPIVRNIVGQRERTIDFRRAMNEGDVILVNLRKTERFTQTDARLLGTLMVTDLFQKALQRPKGSRPFTVVIDECADFLSAHVAGILDQARKFGLHLILAHQHLSQLREAGQAVFSAVMTNARTKIVFGGLSTEDARIVAEQIFMGELDLEEPKTRFNRPMVVGEELGELRNSTWSVNVNTSYGYAWGEQEGGSESESVIGDSEARVTLGKSSGKNSSLTRASSCSDTDTQGWSEQYVRRYETLPTREYSLSEQLYRKAALLVNQGQARAYVKVGTEDAVAIRVPVVWPGYASDERTRRFAREACERAPFVSPTADVEVEITARQEALRTAASGPGGSCEEDEFRE